MKEQEESNVILNISDISKDNDEVPNDEITFFDINNSINHLTGKEFYFYSNNDVFIYKQNNPHEFLKDKSSIRIKDPACSSIQDIKCNDESDTSEESDENDAININNSININDHIDTNNPIDIIDPINTNNPIDINDEHKYCKLIDYKHKYNNNSINNMNNLINTCGKGNITNRDTNNFKNNKHINKHVYKNKKSKGEHDICFFSDHLKNGNHLEDKVKFVFSQELNKVNDIFNVEEIMKIINNLNSIRIEIETTIYKKLEKKYKNFLLSTVKIKDIDSDITNMKNHLSNNLNEIKCLQEKKYKEKLHIIDLISKKNLYKQINLILLIIFIISYYDILLFKNILKKNFEFSSIAFYQLYQFINHNHKLLQHIKCVNNLKHKMFSIYFNRIKENNETNFVHFLFSDDSKKTNQININELLTTLLKIYYLLFKIKPFNFIDNSLVYMYQFFQQISKQIVFSCFMRNMETQQEDTLHKIAEDALIKNQINSKCKNKINNTLDHFNKIHQKKRNNQNLYNSPYQNKNVDEIKNKNVDALQNHNKDILQCQNKDILQCQNIYHNLQDKSFCQDQDNHKVSQAEKFQQNFLSYKTEQSEELIDQDISIYDKTNLTHNMIYLKYDQIDENIKNKNKNKNYGSNNNNNINDRDIYKNNHSTNQQNDADNFLFIPLNELVPKLNDTSSLLSLIKIYEILFDVFNKYDYIIIYLLNYYLQKNNDISKYQTENKTKFDHLEKTNLTLYNKIYQYNNDNVQTINMYTDKLTNETYQEITTTKQLSQNYNIYNEDIHIQNNVTNNLDESNYSQFYNIDNNQSNIFYIPNTYNSHVLTYFLKKDTMENQTYDQKCTSIKNKIELYLKEKSISYIYSQEYIYFTLQNALHLIYVKKKFLKNMEKVIKTIIENIQFNNFNFNHLCSYIFLTIIYCLHSYLFKYNSSNDQIYYLTKSLKENKNINVYVNLKDNINVFVNPKDNINVCANPKENINVYVNPKDNINVCANPKDNINVNEKIHVNIKKNDYKYSCNTLYNEQKNVYIEEHIRTSIFEDPNLLKDILQNHDIFLDVEKKLKKSYFPTFYYLNIKTLNDMINRDHWLRIPNKINNKICNNNFNFTFNFNNILTFYKNEFHDFLNVPFSPNPLKKFNFENIRQYLCFDQHTQKYDDDIPNINVTNKSFDISICDDKNVKKEDFYSYNISCSKVDKKKNISETPYFNIVNFESITSNSSNLLTCIIQDYFILQNLVHNLKEDIHKYIFKSIDMYIYIICYYFMKRSNIQELLINVKQNKEKLNINNILFIIKKQEKYTELCKFLQHYNDEIKKNEEHYNFLYVNSNINTSFPSSSKNNITHDSNIMNDKNYLSIYPLSNCSKIFSFTSLYALSEKIIALESIFCVLINMKEEIIKLNEDSKDKKQDRDKDKDKHKHKHKHNSNIHVQKCELQYNKIGTFPTDNTGGNYDDDNYYMLKQNNHCNNKNKIYCNKPTNDVIYTFQTFLDKKLNMINEIRILTYCDSLYNIIDSENYVNEILRIINESYNSTNNVDEYKNKYKNNKINLLSNDNLNKKTENLKKNLDEYVNLYINILNDSKRKLMFCCEGILSIVIHYLLWNLINYIFNVNNIEIIQKIKSDYFPVTENINTNNNNNNNNNNNKNNNNKNNNNKNNNNNNNNNNYHHNNIFKSSKKDNYNNLLNNNQDMMKSQDNHFHNHDNKNLVSTLRYHFEKISNCIKKNIINLENEIDDQINNNINIHNSIYYKFYKDLKNPENPLYQYYYIYLSKGNTFFDQYIDLHFYNLQKLDNFVKNYNSDIYQYKHVQSIISKYNTYKKITPESFAAHFEAHTLKKIQNYLKLQKLHNT
ncbi:hypothetical protein PFMG_03929 [Plasmodium falciparum IGH-CR14]|uniref:Uncharacterized protein n=1 Tax=Plasmodium falciparum IGH-CR14 TaxID=580059 RepID=A0A0L1IF00_PLAFA|nr:hypothetical protein PFMG_03929 [Plasmodium falciparum IGH-CR14]